MPQRNGQNPIKADKNTGQDKNPFTQTNPHGKPGGGAGHCPACGATVTPKPGFRLSSMKCPQCGASMAKK